LNAANAGTYDLSSKTTTGAALGLNGSSGNDVLRGNAAAQTLVGNDGNDTLDGKGGADSLIGGTGNDTYIFGLGYGADSITDTDATAGNTDILSFAAGTARDQLWFKQSGNDLQVSIIGTSDVATVKNWYLGAASHVEQFKTAAGNTLVDSQVQNLVNAMAGLAPPSTTTLSAAYHSQLDAVIAANWT
jgi:Ca2+-binding RTX toxin-like protein